MTASSSQHDQSRHKADLRRTLRALRRSIGGVQQQRAALQLSSHLYRLPVFWRSRTIAAYWANDSEISLRPLIETAWLAGKQVYLPIIHSSQRMEFHLYKRGDTLRRNQYGIAEPLPRAQQACVSELDLVIAPLVGFDQKGTRLGMGGGFYDRAMTAGKRGRSRFIGAAHSVQQLPALSREDWDQPLQAVVTELGYINCGLTRA